MNHRLWIVGIVFVTACGKSGAEAQLEKDLARMDDERAVELEAARTLSARLSAVAKELPGEMRNEYSVHVEDKPCDDGALRAAGGSPEVVVVYINDLHRATGAPLLVGDGHADTAMWTKVSDLGLQTLGPVADDTATHYDWPRVVDLFAERPFLAVWHPMRYSRAYVSDDIVQGWEGSSDETRAFDPSSVRGALFVTDTRTGQTLCWAEVSAQNSERVSVYSDESVARDLLANVEKAAGDGLARITKILRMRSSNPSL